MSKNSMMTQRKHGETFLMKPKVDFCFKELMEDAEVRRGFISALLNVMPEEIEGTELLPTHLGKEYPEDKLGILDVHVLVHYRARSEGRSLNGRQQMDLEMQIAPFEAWPERSVYYLAKMFIRQIQKGQKYGSLQKCVHVGILDFILFENTEEYYSSFHLWEDARRQMYTDKLEIQVLELPKLTKREYPETEILKWARFFSAERKEEFEMAAETSPYIERAYERLEHISADEIKQLEYDAREKAILDHEYLMSYNLTKGIKQGREEGAKALIEVCQEYSISREAAFEQLVQKLSLSPEAASACLEAYWPEHA